MASTPLLDLRVTNYLIISFTSYKYNTLWWIGTFSSFKTSYLLETRVIRFILFDQCISVYDVLKLIYSINFIGLSILVSHVITNGPQPRFTFTSQWLDGSTSNSSCYLFKITRKHFTTRITVVITSHTIFTNPGTQE